MECAFQGGRLQSNRPVFRFTLRLAAVYTGKSDRNRPCPFIMIRYIAVIRSLTETLYTTLCSKATVPKAAVRQHLSPGRRLSALSHRAKKHLFPQRIRRDASAHALQTAVFENGISCLSSPHPKPHRRAGGSQHERRCDVRRVMHAARHARKRDQRT